MTRDQFETACRWFCRRRPFRSFLVEFASGQQVQIGHPEAIRDEAELYVIRRPDRGSVVFAPDSVARLLDPPPKSAE